MGALRTSPSGCQHTFSQVLRAMVAENSQQNHPLAVSSAIEGCLSQAPIALPTHVLHSWPTAVPQDTETLQDHVHSSQKDPLSSLLPTPHFLVLLPSLPLRCWAEGITYSKQDPISESGMRGIQMQLSNCAPKKGVILNATELSGENIRGLCSDA